MWSPTQYKDHELKRVAEYDYPHWIKSGYRLWDWDPSTGEYILAPLEPNPMSQREARKGA